jgi:hypothetical protein
MITTIVAFNVTYRQTQVKQKLHLTATTHGFVRSNLAACRV